MSNVFARKRKPTELAFIVNAEKIQEEVTMLVMRENVVTKKWRFSIGHGLIAKVDEMVDNIVAANSIFPATEEELNLRRLYQAKAICNCYQVQQRLRRLIKCVPTAAPKNIVQIAEMLRLEIVTLKNWKKAAKISTDASVICCKSEE